MVRDKVLDIAEQIENDEYTKYWVQLFINGLGPHYTKEMKVENYKMSDIINLNDDSKKATLRSLGGFRYDLSKAVLDYPVGYEPNLENPTEWCIEGIIMKIPFYAKSKDGEVNVATLHIQTVEWDNNEKNAGSPFEGYNFRPGRPPIHSTWFDRDRKPRPKIISNEWEIHDVNLQDAINYSGKIVVKETDFFAITSPLLA